MCEYVFECACVTVCVCAYDCVCLGDGTQVIRLKGECLHPLSCLTGPPTCFQTVISTLESEDKGLESINVLREEHHPFNMKSN